MPAITTPRRALEVEEEMFRRTKPRSLYQPRSTTARPLSEATEILDTDIEDESEFDDEYSPKGSFESDDPRRRSQTTISSYDEALTSASTRSQRSFDIQLRPVEGPKGPHLFRSSQSSAELDFDYSMQMSPMLPKETPLRTGTAFSDETVTPVTQQRQAEFSIAAALAAPELDHEDPEAHIRCWSTQQVIDWMYASGLDAPVIECFEVHDVNGAIMLDLEFDDLRELDIQSFGKRHQLWNAICDLRGSEGRISPQPTPFQDTSRPCTTSTNKRSPSRSRSACQSPVDGDGTPISPPDGKKRRGRKAPKALDVITPAESVSIVAIEQLIPKPHKCAKGDRCAKWRKQQRELKQLQDDHAIGRFPISPTKGGHIFVAGNPGNAATADNIVPNVHMHVEDPFRPTSEAIPSIVASSDLLGPGQLPEFALHADHLGQLGNRDPQDNVRNFLSFQHMQSSLESPPTPPPELAHPGCMGRSESVPLFPAQHFQAYPSMPPPTQDHQSGPREGLRNLPRLEIPRSASAAPNLNTLVSPETATSVCRSAAASPDPMIYRLGSPASEMDVPVTAVPTGPIARDASQSVPPGMQFRQQTSLSRSTSARIAAQEWRRPSMALPAVKEGEVFSTVSKPRPSTHRTGSYSSDSSGATLSTLERKDTLRDPAHHSPTVKQFGYGPDCSHAGWMKKRKTKLLRHEWQESHCRLKGTQLDLHDSARLSSTAKDTINVDNYAVACSSVASTNKLTAAMKAFHIKSDDASKNGKAADPTGFAFQLVPNKDGSRNERKAAANSKTHHFAVKTKDDRIDWMRELMLAKALQQKGKGYEIEVNGVQA